MCHQSRWGQAGRGGASTWLVSICGQTACALLVSQVDAVAKAAVTAVIDPSVPPGPMDVWDIMKYEH